MLPPCLLSIVCVVALKAGLALRRWFLCRYWPGRFVLVVCPSGECCVGRRTALQQLIQCGQNVAGRAGGRVCAISFSQFARLFLICEWMKNVAIGVRNTVWWLLCEVIRRHFGVVIMGVGLALQLDHMEDFQRLYDVCEFLREECSFLWD